MLDEELALGELGTLYLWSSEFSDSRSQVLCAMLVRFWTDAGGYIEVEGKDFNLLRSVEDLAPMTNVLAPFAPEKFIKTK